MNLSKNTILLVFIFAIIGSFTFAGSLSTVSAENSTWIAFNSSNVGMSSLTATITATIKNTGSVPAYFKISQTYSNFLTGTITWTVPISDTNPTAEYMIDNSNPGNSPEYNPRSWLGNSTGTNKDSNIHSLCNWNLFCSK